MKTIILKSGKGRVYVNLNTLTYTTHPIIINVEFEKDWVQVEESNVHQFIKEQRAQKLNGKATEAKTE
jgi:hypothetical protein